MQATRQWWLTVERVAIQLMDNPNKVITHQRVWYQDYCEKEEGSVHKQKRKSMDNGFNCHVLRHDGLLHEIIEGRMRGKPTTC